MRYLTFLLLLAGFPIGLFAQQWCAPEAAWIKRYSWPWSTSMAISEYVLDTVLDGYAAQKVRTVSFDLYQGQAYNYATTNGFVTVQGAAVLNKYGLPILAWDTTYYLGNPGEGWWWPGSDDTCPPLNFLVIQDTGHVVIEGISLRTWEVAQLNANGDPSLSSFTITERIGLTSSGYTGYQPCDGSIPEWPFYQLLCYSDVDIGPPCDLTMNLPTEPSVHSSFSIYPNPGADDLRINGLPPGNNLIQVRDPLGRTVLLGTRVTNDAPIETTPWAKGTYFIEVTSQDGTRQVLRWVKE